MPSYIINIKIQVRGMDKAMLQIKSNSLRKTKENIKKRLLGSKAETTGNFEKSLNSYIKKSKKRIKVESKIKSKKDLIEYNFSTSSPIYFWLEKGVRHNTPIQPKWRKGKEFKNMGSPKPFEGQFIHARGKAFALTIGGKQNLFSMYVHPYFVPPSVGFFDVLVNSEENLVKDIERKIK